MAQQVTSSIEPQSQEALPISQTAFGGGQGGPSPAPSSGAAPVGDNPQDLYRKILQMAMQASSPRPVLPQPVPRQVQQQQKGGEVPGYMQSGPQWGFERFSHNLQNQILPTIQNAFGQHKQQQIAKAEADWNVLNTGLQTGNQPLIQSILGDPKKLKEMAKALNQDWMNPKNSVYLQGLQQYAKKQDMDNQKKAGLIQKLKQAFAQKQQMQLNPQQQQALTQEMMGKIGTAQQPPDLKTIMPLVTEFMKQQGETQKEEHQKEIEGMKEKSAAAIRSMEEDSRESIQNLRDLAAERRQQEHDETMLKIAGIKERADEGKKQKSEINTQINSTLTSLRQQYNEANQQLKANNSAASKKSWYQFWKDDPDVAGTQWKVDQLQAAINYVEKNRRDMITGKADMDSVVDQAMKILNTPPPPPGAVANK